MSPKKYLGALTVEDRAKLEQRLVSRQSGRCFICDDPLDLCTAPGFLDSGLKVITSTRPRPARRNRVALGLDSDSRTSPASTVRCTSA